MKNHVFDYVSIAEGNVLSFGKGCVFVAVVFIVQYRAVNERSSSCTSLLNG